MGSGSSGGERSPLIGVLLDHIESDYHVELIESAVRVATRRGARTLILPGGALNKEGVPGRSRGFLYSYLKAADIDGLLLMGGSLSNYSGAEGFERFSRTLPSIPTVVIGLDSATAMTVAVNNHDGVSQIVDHLVDTHGRRKLAYIDGPAESSEASVRRAAYSAAVKRHGLDLGEEYIVPGGLGREQGIDAVVHLLDDLHMKPKDLDAIVAVNDDVALGVLEELARRGISVPSQVAVVGFDDAPNAGAASPPLTTISQRVYEQGATAMGQLLDAINDGTRLSRKELVPQLVKRESCGCHAKLQNTTLHERGVLAEEGEGPRAIEDQQEEIAHNLSRIAQGRLLGGRGWETELVNALITQLLTKTPTFLSNVVRLAHKGGATGIEVCHEVLTELRKEMVRRLPSDSPLIFRAEDLFQEARLALAQASLFREREHHSAQALHLRVITRTCLARAQGAELGELAVALDEQLPMLGIRHYVVSRGRDAELEIIARSGSRGASSTAVSAADLGRDPDLKEEPHVVVLPLSARKRQVGLAVFSYTGADPFLFEQLRDLLGMALSVQAPRRAAVPLKQPSS